MKLALLVLAVVALLILTAAFATSLLIRWLERPESEAPGASLLHDADDGD